MISPGSGRGGRPRTHRPQQPVAAAHDAGGHPAARQLLLIHPVSITRYGPANTTGIPWRDPSTGAYLARMPALIKSVTFDCSDALVLAEFWAAALGTDVDEDATSELAYVEAAGWGGPNMWFARVPEQQAAKNRMPLDLRAPATMEGEVRRLHAIGATVVEQHEGHTVMNDPE